MSKTPRTDIMTDGRRSHLVTADFARQLEAELNETQEWLDMMRDEFQRIKAVQSKDDGAMSEIRQFCDRAVTLISQRVPLVRQLDFATKRLKEVKAELREARANAFEEAAEIAFNNGAIETQRDMKRKAAAIRKGEEK